MESGWPDFVLSAMDGAAAGSVMLSTVNVFCSPETRACSHHGLWSCQALQQQAGNALHRRREGDHITIMIISLFEYS